MPRARSVMQARWGTERTCRMRRQCRHSRRQRPRRWRGLSVETQINRRLAGCAVGRCQERGGAGSMQVRSCGRSASSVAGTNGTGPSVGTLSPRFASWLRSPWLQCVSQMMDSTDGEVRWQPAAFSCAASGRDGETVQRAWCASTVWDHSKAAVTIKIRAERKQRRRTRFIVGTRIRRAAAR